MNRHDTIVLLLLISAGCVHAPSDPDVDAPQDFMMALEDALVDDHDHRDPAAHPEFVRGATILGRMPLLPSTEVGNVHPHEASKILDGYYYQAVQNPPSGVAIYDVSDPAAPRLVSHYDAGVSWNTGLDVSPDGRWLFVAAEWTFGAPRPPQETPQHELDAAVEGPDALASQVGIHIVDVADKARPTRVLVQPGPDSGYHKVVVSEIGGALHVFASAFVGNAGVDIYRFEPQPVPRLELVSHYQADASTDPEQSFIADSAGALANGALDPKNARSAHDVFIEPDPIDGSSLMVVSYWADGVHFVDVSDPADPRRLGIWDEFTVFEHGSVMTAHVTNVEGRRVAVAIPEIVGAHEREGIVWIIDVTDFADPELLGTWELPGIHPQTESLLWSTHNFVILDNKIYLAHWHAGAYVLDIGTLDMARSPVLRAAILPEGIDPRGSWEAMRSVDALEVAVNGKHLYISGPDLVVAELAPEARPG